MKIGVALRVSLLIRMLVALSILASVSLGLGIVISFFGGLASIYVFGFLDYLASLPRLSTYLPIAAWNGFALATLALMVLIALRVTDLGPNYGDERPGVLVVWFGVFVSLYLVVVEGAAVLASVLLSPLGVVLVVLGCVVASIWATIHWVRGEIRGLRERLVADSVSACEEYAELDSTIRRLATLADVPAPNLYITEQERPESFTVGSGESAAVVVSTGTIDVLSSDELEAVLAHEVSHLANRDSRIMAAALAPVLIADDWMEDDPDELFDHVWNAFFSLLKLYAQFGVAVLSRGREWGADAGAVALTGSPAALASALERLDEGRRRPETDLRDWETSVAAIDILPPADGEVDTGPFRTHPSTEKRIERLESMAAQIERR